MKALFRHASFLLVAATIAAGSAACTGSPGSSPVAPTHSTPSPSATSSPSPAASPTSSPSATPSASPTPKATATATPSPTPSPTPTTAAAGLIYVANYQGGQILGFNNAGGNNAPVVNISGSNTQLTAPVGLALDASGNLYATNLTGTSVLIFPHGSNGNVTPTVLGGSNAPTLGPSQGIAFDHNGLIYVSAYEGFGSISVFAANSTGNVAPLRVIQGPATELSSPGALALDSSNNLWVSQGNNGILEFPAGANGNVSPIAVLVSDYAPDAIAIDSQNRLIASEGNSLVIYASNPTSAQSPATIVFGTNTGLGDITSLGVDALDNIYVGQAFNDQISVFPSTASGNVAPILTLFGGNTLLNQPYYPRAF